jgi:hypothetical protein
VNENVYIHGNRYFENTASTHGMKFHFTVSALDLAQTRS